MELELIRKLLYKWVDKIVEDLERESTETIVEFEPPTIIKIGETEAQPKTKTETKAKTKFGRTKLTQDEKDKKRKEYMRKYREKNKDKIRKQQMEHYYKKKAEKEKNQKDRVEQWKHAGELFPKTNEDLVY